MHIRLTDTRKGMTAEVLCDVCGLPIDLDETCDYLFPRAPAIKTDSKIAHSTCALIPGRFPNHWTQMVKPRSILHQIADSNRSSVITNFLSQLAEDRQKRLAAKDSE